MQKKAGIDGKVYILIFLSEAGKVDDTKVVKGIGNGCDEAAIAAIKKCTFTPGQQAGKNEKVKFAIMVEFKLN